MGQRIVSPNLSDIVEAIDRIRASLTGSSLEDFENNWEKRWLVERGSKSFQKPAAACLMT
jgi:hypothetical protein